ncbi:MAG: hypothetical protein V3W41_11860 [Planctomycetota bacterium]
MSRFDLIFLSVLLVLTIGASAMRAQQTVPTLTLSAEIPDLELSFGEPFQIVVETRWSDDLALLPDNFEEALEIFSAKLVARESGRLDEESISFERLTFRALALARDHLVLPRIEIRARPLAGGLELKAEHTSPDRGRRVASSLNAEEVGPAEFPEAWTEMPREVDGAMTALLLALIFSGCGGLWYFRHWLWQKLRRGGVPQSGRACAEARLEFLKNDLGAKKDADLAERISAILHQFLQDELSLPAAQRTTLELREQTTLAGQRPQLFALLERCEIIKYSGDGSAQAAPQNLLRDAEACLLSEGESA